MPFKLSRLQIQISAVIITFSLISVGFIGMRTYNTLTNNAIKNLESANFTIIDLDITGIESNKIYYTASVQIQNLSIQDQNIEILSTSITLFYNKTIITNFQLESSNLIFSDIIEISSFIEIYDGQINPETQVVIENILNANYFDFSMIGTIQYKKIGIKDTITFNNTVGFRTSRNISLDIKKIYPPNKDNSTLIDFVLYNPYSADLQFKVDGKLRKGENLLATLDAQQSVMIASGYNQVSVLLFLNRSLSQTFNDLLTNSKPIVLDATFSIDMDGKNIVQHREFKFDLKATNSVDFKIKNILGYGEDASNHTIVFLDLNIYNSLPLEFNISYFKFKVTTVSFSSDLGIIEWDSVEPVQIFINGTSLCHNVSFTILNTFALIQLKIEQAIRIPSGQIGLEINKKIIDIPFTINRLEIDI